MLATARLATQSLHTAPDEQTVVIIGRYASAGFAAIGVLAFALLGYLRRGPAGYLAVGLLLGLHHQVFELAHYFKEDTALLMGFGLSFLALALYWDRQTTPRLIFLGVACGLSISAKYLGVVVLIPALLAIHFARSGTTGGRGSRRAGLVSNANGKESASSSWLPYLLFLAAFFATITLANYPLLNNLDTFRNSFHREVTLVRADEGGGRMPFLEYLKIFVSNTNPAIWLFLGINLIQQWRTRANRSALDWIITIFPFVFVALLSCSHKTNDRYFLPATALFSYLAALGICDAADLLSAKMPRQLTLAVALSLTCFFQIVQIPWINSHSLSEYFQAFQHDDRAELLQWIRTNLPREAVLAQDNRADLPTARRNSRLKIQGLLEQKVLDSKQLTDFGPMEGLAQKGITHVVVSESDYGKFFRKAWTPHNSGDAQKKKLYDDLFKHAKSLWERPRATVIYLHPGLQLFELPGQSK